MNHWLDLQASITGPRPENTLLVATTGDGAVIATVVVARALKQIYAYKGEIRKLLMHPDFRGGEVGAAMMAEAERAARDELEFELLVLDTPARLFYLID
ncbi:hypothetical protein F4823DRAFT_605231 [Ustulina deusta]|nr:hypothetical protein F4823DRAFT_605231 [Ustulina deusta]